MGRDWRLFASYLSLRIWFACSFLLASVSVSFEAEAVPLQIRTGRLLLQDASAVNTTNAVHVHQKLSILSLVLGVVSVVIAILFLLLTTIGYFQDRWEHKAGAQHLHLIGSSARPFIAPVPEKFFYKELQSGTLNFTEILGGGKFGKDYKGVLSNVTDVAVRRLAHCPRAEFEADVQKVAGLHHENLVQLYGYCLEGDHRLLVYEYLSKGALINYLYGSFGSNSELSRNPLTWGKRFRIVLGTAKALAYLHDHCGDEGFKIHGRVQPESILLTEDYSPKLANFGFTRPLERDDASTLATSAKGMHEYFAPEWWTADRSVALTPKADVYSFGILVLEIVGGRRIGEFYERQSWEFPDLASKEGEESPGFSDLLDPGLVGHVDIPQLRAALHVAYWCIQSEAEARPSMAKVVGYLEGRFDIESPPTPSSSVVFTPAHDHKYSNASREDLGFSRRMDRPEIANDL